METIQGKTTRMIDAAELAARLAGRHDVLLDLGTGDGKFALHAARSNPGLFALGVDACRENLRGPSRAAPRNALFVIANASCLPGELHRLAGWVTINFPWGSLRDGLLDGDPALLNGLRAVMRPGARLEVRLNASALAEVSCTLEGGGQQICRSLAGAGFALHAPRPVGPEGLRECPSTWSKRLAFGREPRAIYLSGTMRD